MFLPAWDTHRLCWRCRPKLCAPDVPCSECEGWDVEAWASCSGFLADRLAERTGPLSPSTDSNSTRIRLRLQRREAEIEKLASVVVKSLAKISTLPSLAVPSPSPGSAGSSTVTSQGREQSLCFARALSSVVSVPGSGHGKASPPGPPGMRGSCSLRHPASSGSELPSGDFPLTAPVTFVTGPVNSVPRPVGVVLDSQPGFTGPVTVVTGPVTTVTGP